MSDQTLDSVFDFLVKYKTKHNGNTPSLREIMVGCNISSTSVVNYHLMKLEIGGKIKREGIRGIEIPGSTWTYHEEYTQPAVDIPK